MVTTARTAVSSPAHVTSHGSPSGPVTRVGTSAEPVVTRSAAPRLHTLDGLRFVAAVGVMLYHFTAMWSTVWGTTPGEVFPGLGGVMIHFVLAPELFFVVSGFVILWTAWGRGVADVVASRVARLYPPYWAALLLTSVLLLVVWPQGKEVTLGDALVNVTLLQEGFGVRHVDGVYWTLWTELRFYVLVVAFVAIGMTRRRVVWVTALWAPVALLADRAGNELASTVLISQHAPYFAGGMLLFLIYRDGHSVLRWSLVGLNITLALHTTVEATIATIGRVTAFTTTPLAIGITVVATFALVALLTLTPAARLHSGLLMRLGALTYSLYLVHQFWGLWVIDRLSDSLPPAVTLGAAVAVSTGLALVVHHGVEKRVSPAMRRGLEQAMRRRTRQGIPPTSPGSIDPSMIEPKSSTLRSSSSSTVEPTPPGR